MKIEVVSGQPGGRSRHAGRTCSGRRETRRWHRRGRCSTRCKDQRTDRQGDFSGTANYRAVPRVIPAKRVIVAGLVNARSRC